MCFSLDKAREPAAIEDCRARTTIYGDMWGRQRLTLPQVDDMHFKTHTHTYISFICQEVSGRR